MIFNAGTSEGKDMAAGTKNNAADRTNKAELYPPYLLIALLPALVFALNMWVITHFAVPFDVPPPKIAAFDVDSEGAARIGMLATFMLFVGAALAALFFFAYTLRMFDWRGRFIPILAFLGMAIAAIMLWMWGGSQDAHDYGGRTLACLAAGYTKADSDLASGTPGTGQAAPRSTPSAPGNQPAASPPSQAQSRDVEVARLPYRDGCRNARFENMRRLGPWQFLGVAFSFAGLVIGAICCLATKADQAPPVPSPMPGGEAAAVDNPELRHWEHQAEWLNTYLYLAALLLGTALMFINAYLRWPSYILLDPAKYHEHTAALVSYYGVVFTIMLASFYIPVATILTGKVKDLKPAAQGESKLPAAFKGPLQILKIVLGLFSTALAGALPGILALVA
jgi:hypothetical protein